MKRIFFILLLPAFFLLSCSSTKQPQIEIEQKIDLEMITIPNQICYIPENTLGYGIRRSNVKMIQNSNDEKYKHSDFVAIESFQISKYPLTQNQIDAIVAWADSSERIGNGYDFTDEIELQMASDHDKQARNIKLFHPYLLYNALSEMQEKEPVYWIYEYTGNGRVYFHPLRSLYLLVDNYAHTYDFEKVVRLETANGYRCPNDIECLVFLSTEKERFSQMNEIEKYNFQFMAQDHVEMKECATIGLYFPVLSVLTTTE